LQLIYFFAIFYHFSFHTLCFCRPSAFLGFFWPLKGQPTKYSSFSSKKFKKKLWLFNCNNQTCSQLVKRWSLLDSQSTKKNSTLIYSSELRVVTSWVELGFLQLIVMFFNSTSTQPQLNYNSTHELLLNSKSHSLLWFLDLRVLNLSWEQVW